MVCSGKLAFLFHKIGLFLVYDEIPVQDRITALPDFILPITFLFFSFEVLPVPLLSGAAEAEVSSACKENDEEKSEGEDEETLYLNPLKGKIKSVAEDFTMAVNQ